jgi:hypothetical protein
MVSDQFLDNSIRNKILRNLGRFIILQFLIDWKIWKRIYKIWHRVTGEDEIKFLEILS